MKPEAQRIAIAEACGWKGTNKNNFTPPDYLNDLTSAISLANHLSDLGWRCECNNGLDKTWEASFWKPANSMTPPANKGYRDGVITEEHYAPADSLSEAICEAGLRAAGKWKDE